MTRRGRRANTIRKLPIKLYLEEHLVARMEMLLLDPLTGRIPYGAQSKFISHLIEAHFRKNQSSEHTQTTPIHTKMAHILGFEPDIDKTLNRADNSAVSPPSTSPPSTPTQDIPK